MTARNRRALFTISLTLAAMGCDVLDRDEQASAEPLVPPPTQPSSDLSTAKAEETAEPEAPSCGPKDEIPDIPSERSDPPKGEEWAQACELNTQGPATHPPDCTTKILREWYQVSCRGNVTGYEQMQHFGKEGFDYFKQVQPGNVVSFVMRLEKGRNQQVRICRSGERASVFVSWPSTKGKPSIVAVGKGPACDGSAFGATH